MSRIHILAVDDDRQVLQSVSRDLRSRYGEEYRILRADSGQAALDAVIELRDLGEHIALIVSDQRMPGMDGTTLLGKVLAYYPNCKRVLLTAYSDIDAAVSAINDSHIDYYLLKPWDPPEEKLYPVLDDLLQDWQAGFRPGFGGIRLIGDRWSALGHQIRDFLSRNHVPYTFEDVEKDEDAAKLAATANQLPLLVHPDGTRQEAPSIDEIASYLGLQQKATSPFYDLAIVGAGPAGLATAVYAGSEGLNAVLIEEDAPGGQAGTSSLIENYLGFPSGLSGNDLARRAVAQTKRFGVEMLIPQAAESLRVEGPYRYLKLRDGSEIAAHALLLTTGVYWRRLPATGAEGFSNQGVYYGAALTEAKNMEGEVVHTVGAGNSAGQAAMYFAAHAEKVIMLVRGDSLEAKMSQYLIKRIYSTPNIEVRLHTEILECQGSNRMESMSLKNRKTGAITSEPATRLFVFIGAAPRTEWLGGQIKLDEHGFILTGPDLNQETHLKDWPLERSPFMLETSIPGVFAAGDVRHESVKRVASAVGEGSVSVHFVHRHLSSL